ncbi:hypothetical protein ANCDUO_08881, partial [Ancylostoma duodenale]
FTFWNIVFLVVRLASSVLTVMTFWYGLRQSETAYIDVASGNYNTTYVRESASKKVKSETKRLVPQPKGKKNKSEESVSENEQSEETDGSVKKGKKKTN